MNIPDIEDKDHLVDHTVFACGGYRNVLYEHALRKPDHVGFFHSCSFMVGTGFLH